jgi:hypothetical protein
MEYRRSIWIGMRVQGIITKRILMQYIALKTTLESSTAQAAQD